MNDNTIYLPKWSEIEPHLREHGILTTRLHELQKGLIARMLHTEHDIGNGYDISVLGADNWKEIVAGLIEEHPTWASEEWKLRKHASDLLEQFTNDWGGSDELAELVKHKYAIVTRRDDDAWVNGGDTAEDIANAEMGAALGPEYDVEYIDGVYDLTTGKLISYKRVVTFTVTLEDGTTATINDQPKENT